MRSRAAVLLSVVALALGSSSAQATPPPRAFDVSAVAVVAEVSSTQEPAASIITAGLLDATAGYASSALRDGGSAESIAAPVYPGDLVAGGPQLLCQELFPCPVAPPAYPLAADAAFPTQPDAQTPGPAGAALSGVATARPSTTSARALAAAIPGLPFTWGAGTATTHGWVTAGAAHILAVSSVHDLSVGPLHIEQLTSSDLIDVPVGQRPVDRPSIRLAGVSLAGQAASIDQDGVHVAGQSAGQTAQSLAQQGLEVKLMGTSQQDAVGAARSAAGGLQVRVSLPVSGAPNLPGLPGPNRVYVATVLLGGVGAIASASSADDLDLSLATLPPPTSLTTHLTPPVAARAPLPTAVVPGQITAPTAVPPPHVALPVAHIGLFDLSPVAAALAVIPTGLLLLWRLRVTLRRRPT